MGMRPPLVLRWYARLNPYTDYPSGEPVNPRIALDCEEVPIDANDCEAGQVRLGLERPHDILGA